MTSGSADPHVAASLKVRNDVRKAKMLAKQEAMLKDELASIQKDIDDLVRNAPIRSGATLSSRSCRNCKLCHKRLLSTHEPPRHERRPPLKNDMRKK